MAKDIVQYQTNVLPSGKTGETMTPYEEAPPMTPINIAAAETAAKVKLGDTVEQIGENVAKVQFHNEIIAADNMAINFETQLSKQLNKTMSENQGTNAMKPDFIPTAEQNFKEMVQAQLDSADLSGPAKDVLSKVLNHHVLQATSHLLTFQRQETHGVENANIQADLEQRYANVKAGANPDEEILNHYKAIDRNQPGNDQLKLLHAVRIREHGTLAQQKLKEAQAFQGVLDDAFLSPDVIEGKAGQTDKALALWSDASTTMEKYKLTLPEWKEGLVALSALKTQERNESVRVMDKVSLDARQLYSQRKLTTAAIFELSAKIPDFGVRDNFQKEMFALSEHQVVLAKQLRALDAATTDPVALATLHEQILREGGDPLQKPELQRAILTTPGIGENHRNVLLDKLYSKIDGTQRESEKLAKDLVKSQIVSTGPLGTPVAAEWNRLYKAYDAIDNYADIAKRAGKPWTQEQYMTYARQLADEYRPTMTSHAKETMEQATGKKTATTPVGVVLQRNPGESLADFDKRVGKF